MVRGCLKGMVRKSEGYNLKGMVRKYVQGASLLDSLFLSFLALFRLFVLYISHLQA